MGSYESGVVGEDDGLDAVVEVELGEDVADVGLDGGSAEEEFVGDVGVGCGVGGNRSCSQWRRSDSGPSKESCRAACSSAARVLLSFPTLTCVG